MMKANNILLIDDNPYQFKAILNTLLSMLKIPIDLKGIRPGQFKEIDINESISIIFYYYNVSTTLKYNIKNIKRIVKNKSVNTLWIDYGYIKTVKIGNELNVKETSGQWHTATEILSDGKLLKAIYKNNLCSILVYSLNKWIREDDIISYKDSMINRIINSNKIENLNELKSKIFFIENSPTFNLHSEKYNVENSFLSNPKVNPKVEFLGHIRGFELYGTLVGNLLFDFYKKYILKDVDDYNHFKRDSFDFLHFFKLLNNIHNSKYRLGQVSYYTYYKGETLFLIDVPYKEYYKKYDSIVDTEQLFDNIVKNNHITNSGYCSFSYMFDNKNNKISYNLESDLANESVSIGSIAKFMSMLHTAVFYEPTAFNDTNDTFNICVEQQQEPFNSNFTRLLFFYDNTILGKKEGCLNFTLWKHCEKGDYLHENEAEIKKIKREYYEFLKPKAEETLLPLFLEEKNKNALQAAVAQIFARNFAHNIGSHVAIRATNETVKERIIELYCKDKKSRKEKREVFKNDAITDWLDYASGVLDMYEVVKNEFLAEYKLPPKNTSLYRNIILPFAENTLIMDNIAHSEQVSYDENGKQNKLKIKVFHNDTELKSSYPILSDYQGNSNINYPNNFPYLLKVAKDENGQAEEDKENGTTLRDAINSRKIDNDIEICLASEHSIYSILENFIRNSAKHNKETLASKDLEVQLRVCDANNNPNFYDLYLYDNVSSVTIETLLKLQKGIDADLFKEDGQLSRTSLGIADMKINAYLLQSADEIENERLKTTLDLVYCNDCNEPYNGQLVNVEELVKKVTDTTTKYQFAYRLKLSKPKKVLWIGKEDEKNKEEWRGKGVIFEDKTDNIFDQNHIEKQLIAYSFAILEPDSIKDYDEDRLDDLLLKLPFRVLINCKVSDLGSYSVAKQLYEDRRIQTVDKCLLPTDFVKKENNIVRYDDFALLNSCWENWLRKWCLQNEDTKKLKAHLYIDLQNKEQTNKWKNFNFDEMPFKITFLDFREYKDTERTKLNSNDFVVFFDRHAEGLYGKCNSVSFNFLDNGSYFEFDKSSEDFVKLFYPSENIQQNKLFLFEALEAGLMNVCVFDERIADKLNYTDKNIEKLKVGFCVKKDEWGDKMPGNNGDLMNNGQTFVVSHFQQNELSSSAKNFTFEIDEQKIKIIPPLHITKNIKYDGLIIHRTYLSKLLDEWLKSVTSSDKKSQAKIFLRELNKQFGRIIITSGGGYPHSLPVNVNFQPFSLVSKNFVKYQSKISLIKLF